MRVTVYLTEAEWKHLRELGFHQHRSISELVREAIREKHPEIPEE
jgi:hypothetical protein